MTNQCHVEMQALSQNSEIGPTINSVSFIHSDNLCCVSSRCLLIIGGDLVSSFFIVFFQKIKEFPWKTKWEDMSLKQKILNKTIWFLGTGQHPRLIFLSTIMTLKYTQSLVRIEAYMA